MFSLLIFPPAVDAHCTLESMDGGPVMIGAPAVHPEGRPGQAFDIPDTVMNGHGAILRMQTSTSLIEQRGILYLRVPEFNYPWSYPEKTAAFETDDYREPTYLKPPPVGRAGVVRIV